MILGITDNLAQLLQCPGSTRVGRHVQVRETTRAVLDHDEHVQRAERRRYRDEEVRTRGWALLWFFRKVDQRWSPRGWPGARFGIYLRTVLGETQIPSFSSSSLATRSSPERWFSFAIRRISARSSSGIGGGPRRDFTRHSSLQPARCQRIMVAGCTTTKAPRQSNNLERSARLMRVPASILRGFTHARGTARAGGAGRGSRLEGPRGAEQQHHPPKGIFDQTDNDPREGGHALMVPQRLVWSLQARHGSRTRFLRRTAASTADT